MWPVASGCIGIHAVKIYQVTLDIFRVVGRWLYTGW